MFDLQGRATQTRSGVMVRLAGLLANSCMRAEVSGTYPGSIMYLVDPGRGEVHIREWRDPAVPFCAQHLVPWHATVMLHDFSHEHVDVSGNDGILLTLTVEGRPAGDEEHGFIVTALVGADGGPFHDCAVHRKDDIILAIYRRVFGPDTRAACEAFRERQCTKLDPAGTATFASNASMLARTRSDFTAAYETVDGRSHLVVRGKVTAIDGETITLRPAKPPGINPLVLLLELHVEPFPGPIKPHTARVVDLVYSEPADVGSYSSIFVQAPDGGFSVAIAPS